MIKLFRYLKSYYKAVILAPVLMFIEVVMELLQPTLKGYDTLLSEDGGNLSQGQTAFVNSQPLEYHKRC